MRNIIKNIDQKINEQLTKRLDEFRLAFLYQPKKFFLEVAFCILTPQSKALNAWKIIETLEKDDLIFKLDEYELSEYLNTIRFKNTKAKRLVKLRNQMTVNGILDPKSVIFNTDDIMQVRKWIYENIDGMGLKEASHLLRNLGFGNHFAILDRHILRVLNDLGVINEIPKTLTYNKYIEIENKMKEFSKEINISMERLDLVLWYRQVGYIFK